MICLALIHCAKLHRHSLEASETVNSSLLHPGYIEQLHNKYMSYYSGHCSLMSHLVIMQFTIVATFPGNLLSHSLRAVEH